MRNKKNKGQPINTLQSKLAVILCAGFFASSVCADIVFDSVGVLEADSVKKFSGLGQHGLLLGYTVRSESNKFWIPTSLDFSAGWFSRGSDAAAFVSFGPTYRIHLGKSDYGRWFTDIGSHPTYIANSTFDGKPLGGKIFFTSYLGIGAYLGSQRKTSFLVRYQHTSNAGLDDNNPGVDMIGLTLSYHFGSNERLLAAGKASD